MAKEKAEEKKAAAPGGKETAAEAAPQGQAAPGAQGGAVPAGFTIKEDGAATTRADYFAGSFAITEALLAFGRIEKGDRREINIDTKIVVSIRDAKRVFLTLQQLIGQYEDKYGTIRI